MIPVREAIGLEEELFLELARACQLARKFADDALTPFGITPAEYNLLRIVQRTQGVTASQAQERLMVAAPSVAQLVRNLEAKKLLKRVRSATDARVQHLHLTPSGNDLVERARAEVRRRSKKVLPAEPAIRGMIKHLHSIIESLSSYLH